MTGLPVYDHRRRPMTIALSLIAIAVLIKTALVLAD